MSDPATYQLLAAGMAAVPALLFAIVAWNLWRYLHDYPQETTDLYVLLALGALLGMHYALWAILPLLPTHLAGQPNAFRGAAFALMDGGVVALYPLGRHFALLWSTRGTRPRWTWLAVNYGGGLCAAVLFVLADLRLVQLPLHGQFSFFSFFTAYLVGMALLTMRDLRRLARQQRWRAGGLGELGSADAWAFVVGLGCVIVSQFIPPLAGTTLLRILVDGRASPAAFWFHGLHALGGLVMVMPFAVRDLAHTLSAFLIACVGLAVTAAGYLAARGAGAWVADPELQRVVDLGTVAAVVILLTGSQAWLRGGIDRLVFHRSRTRWAEVQALLQTLSPELGVLETARRALTEVVRAMQFRGAALLLADGSIVSHGEIAAGPLAAAWPRDPGALPGVAFGHTGYRWLPTPLREALIEAEVTAVIPVVSPRRRWGHVAVRTDLLGAVFTEDDHRAVGAAASQVALLLDGAELVARTVAVERSLAHAEKLAAIGELAARIAHDIRNPVTAARSLAQQLAREPDTPFATEHGVILEELERVERRVAALLRFSRRETLDLGPVDLGELVRATVGGLRSRIDAAAVTLSLDAPDGIAARADREQLRQVLINLLENACDALSAQEGRRALDVSVGNGGGVAVIRVADSGPGVPADALPRLFEPFFSLKPTGTGLGLAIARRTVEAHGGRIVASASGSGMTFDIELPVDGAEER